VGGEVRARGKNAEGQSWRLGIVRPTPGGGQIPELVVPLEQLSMATSGNYRNYILHNEEVVSHAMDGRTGQPVKHGLASVSVLHADCMLADAWATALYVLGVEEGLPLAEQQKLAVLFLTPDGDTFTRQSSSSFPDALD
jgi:thiamine biosynthesis lipoprotein